MTEQEENMGIVEQLYDAFERCDISSLLNKFTYDAILHGHAPGGLLPWGGVHKGRRGAAEFFMAVGEPLEPQ